MNKETETLCKALKEAEARVMKKIKRKMRKLSKDPKLLLETEKELKKWLK